MTVRGGFLLALSLGCLGLAACDEGELASGSADAGLDGAAALDGGGGDAADLSADPGVELNPGWIGGACATSGDCGNPGAECLTLGFPGGLCTQACAVGASGVPTCPDADLGPLTLNTISRCIDTPDGPPRCVSGCDLDKSPTGCRPGYRCVLRQRASRPDDIFPVCLPASEQGWPGELPRANDVGAACARDADCGHLACLPLPGGYCTKTLCKDAGCPTGSSCFEVNNGEMSACLKDCVGSGDCRAAEGYTCDPDSVCWAQPTQVPWDASMSAADCASVWPGGLSACDLVPDRYLVVRKSARNVALCDQGALVGSFRGDLGFAPSGDKAQSGDGRTPEGVFYIPRLVPMSSYYKAFLLSYPDVADAEAGLSAGKISASDRDAIVAAQLSCAEPPQLTGLGGLIEVHGQGGSGQDWTWGCVAVSNPAVDSLWAELGVGDSIVVLP